MLEKVKNPQDLRKLSIPELNSLAGQVRDTIVTEVAKKGGHLASSLGAVELCIALHYCLNTPQDKIVFDVGHQAYSHKIITGRQSKFCHIREYRGISGFPNPQESEYDVFISGHASTAVSWAQGLAEANRLSKDESKVVAVVGDGSLTGGMCFEALNSCGHRQSDVLVILNHNEMSIAPSVGALSQRLTKIISAPIYNRIKNQLEDFFQNSALGKRLVSKARKFEEAVKGLVIPGIFFEELGFRYFGPVDGHNLETLIPTIKNLASLKGPRILHVITKKGKGYKPAEENPEDSHSASPFDKVTGAPLKTSKESFGEAAACHLIDLARRDSRIVAITAAMVKGTGLDQFAKEFPQRLFDLGIAEEHAVGFAGGLARGGLRPVVAIYSTFLQRAYDQIIHDVALQKLPVVFMLDRSGVVGEDGPTHHGVFDIGYLRGIPNMVCMAPKDKDEMFGMLDLAFRLDQPVGIRYPKGEAYQIAPAEKIALGKAEVVSNGKDLCIVAVGAMVKTALASAELLKKDGIQACVVNARFVKPLDEQLLISLARQFGGMITLEDGNLSCGFGSAVLELFEQNDMNDKVKIIRLGFPDEFITFASREELLRLHGLDPASVAAIGKKAVKEELLWQK